MTPDAASSANLLVAHRDNDADAQLFAYTDWWDQRGITLYPAQEQALVELAADSHVILSTPTGSGKSLVASGALFFGLHTDQRSFYTAPIKALVSEKFFDLCRLFGADNVGMLTGDASVNPTAPIICATAEILANIALRQGDRADIGVVVMDEFHFYAEPDRGWAWQVPLLELPDTQFVLMSATLGDVRFFADDLRRRTGREVAEVTGGERPIPLSYRYEIEPLHDTIERLVTGDQAPVYAVHFTQAAAAERAQSLLSMQLCTKEEKAAIATALGEFRFSSGFGRTLSRLVRSGVGIHHAGMLPRYRRLVENLAQKGLLKVICGTDTLGVGINVPIRTVLFTGLTKFDGIRLRHLRSREFHQIAGRAGRAGFDTEGTVVVMAPEHDIENARLLSKAGTDPKKRRKVQRKKPPEGFVSWGEGTFEKLVAAPPEPLVSRLRITDSTLLNLIARHGNCFDSTRALIENSHETRSRQLDHFRQAISLYRGLLTAGVVERLDSPDADGRWVRVTADLPENFALSSPLSTFALAAFDLVDPQSPDAALDIISVVEATLEDPRQVLMAQRRAARDEAMASMKADGVEYDERMDRLDEISWPTPLAEILVPAFTTFRSTHPWVRGDALSPKSVLRQMIEQGMTFHDMISRYQLARSEGVLLRYLTDCYRTLTLTVPPALHTNEFVELVDWLGDLIRRVDSSLLDEWEALTHPDAPRTADADTPPPINPRAYRVHVRNALFAIVLLLAREDWHSLHRRYPDLDWEGEFTPYFDDYDDVGISPNARGPQLFSITEESSEKWRVRQQIDDPDGDRGWSISAVVTPNDYDEDDLPRLREIEILPG